MVHRRRASDGPPHRLRSEKPSLVPRLIWNLCTTCGVPLVRRCRARSPHRTVDVKENARACRKGLVGLSIPCASTVLSPR